MFVKYFAVTRATQYNTAMVPTPLYRHSYSNSSLFTIIIIIIIIIIM